MALLKTSVGYLNHQEGNPLQQSNNAWKLGPNLDAKNVYPISIKFEVIYFVLIHPNLEMQKEPLACYDNYKKQKKWFP